MFNGESMGHVPMQQPLFRESEELIEVMRDTVLDLLVKLKIGKFPGPVGIHPRVHRGLKYGIVDLLTHICNLSLNLAAVPEDQRVANVTLIFKKRPRRILASQPNVCPRQISTNVNQR